MLLSILLTCSHSQAKRNFKLKSSCWCCLFSGRGRSHGPHKFYIPVVPRRHSFDERIFAAPVSKMCCSVPVFK